MTTRVVSVDDIFASANIMSIAASASSDVIATTTPLPAAKPSAFITIGAPSAFTYSWASAALVKVAYFEVGMLCRTMNCLAKSFEDSNCAARCVGPKIFNPAVFLSSEGKNDEIKRLSYNPPLRTSDNELLQELSIFAVYMHGTKKGILGNDEALKINGTALIEYLQKEYHLE